MRNMMMMMMKREKKLKNGCGLDGSCIGERELSVKYWGLFSVLWRVGPFKAVERMPGDQCRW